MKLRRFAQRCPLVIILFCSLFYLNSHRFEDQVLLAIDKVLDEVLLDLLSSIISAPSQEELAVIYHSQSTLSCFVQEGKWNRGSNRDPGPAFTPNGACLQDLAGKLVPLSSLQSPSIDICKLIAGQKILLVGPESTYYLHSLWLASLESYEKRPHTCLGQSLCTFHHICRLPSTGSENGFGQYETPRRKKQIPGTHALQLTKSSVVRFSLSTTLHTSDNRHDIAYTRPVVDQQSGIRVQNTHWIRHARKSDIVVMNRGPLPAPQWTYPSDGTTANWTFVVDLCGKNNYLEDNDCKGSLEQLLVNAALHATLDHFLPSLLLSLNDLSTDFELYKTRLVWHGSWYIQPSCAKLGLPDTIPLLWGIPPHSKDTSVDPWSFYYNCQVYMHDHLLSKLLPHFNITYIPLVIPPYPDIPISRFWRIQKGFSPPEGKDCLRAPWPTFGKDVIERTFFQALSTLLLPG